MNTSLWACPSGPYPHTWRVRSKMAAQQICVVFLVLLSFLSSPSGKTLMGWRRVQTNLKRFVFQRFFTASPPMSDLQKCLLRLNLARETDETRAFHFTERIVYIVLFHASDVVCLNLSLSVIRHTDPRPIGPCAGTTKWISSKYEKQLHTTVKAPSLFVFFLVIIKKNWELQLLCGAVLRI